MTKLTYAKIGTPLRKDHATTMHGINTLLRDMIYPANRVIFEDLVQEFLLKGYAVPEETAEVVRASQRTFLKS